MRATALLFLCGIPAISSLAQPQANRRSFLGTTAAGASIAVAGPAASQAASPLVKGDESLMKQKAHGTTEST